MRPPSMVTRAPATTPGRTQSIRLALVRTSVIGVGPALPGSSGGVPLRPVDDLGVRREPHVRPRAGVADHLLEDPDARPVPDDVRVHRELEDAPLLVGGVELAPEDV